MSSPKVSVAMPVCANEQYVGEAISSILSQTFTDFELLLILDGATPAVKAVVSSFSDTRIRCINLPVNMGIASARNVGLSQAVGDYLAIMDSDDIALPTRLARQVEYLDANPGITAVGSQFVKLLSDGTTSKVPYPLDDAQIKAKLLLVDNAIHNPTVTFRLNFSRQNRIRENENRRRDSDYDTWIEFARLGANFANLPDELLIYRKHENNITQNRVGIDLEKTQVRAPLASLYFPELTGTEIRILLAGMCETVQLSLVDACHFVGIAGKAAKESRVFIGEDRDELRRILVQYGSRLLAGIQGANYKV